MNNLSFGEFTIDCSLRQLRRGEDVLPVYGKSFDLLVYMASNPGRPLLKSELLSAVWPDTIVEEANLSQNVSLIRKVIGSGSDGPILTLPGRGYQFAAHVTRALPDAPAQNAEPRAIPTLGEAGYSLEATHTRIVVESEVVEGAPVRRHGLVFAGLGAGIVLTAIGGWFGWQGWLDRTGGPPVNVVIGTMEGTTGDPALDRALVQALRMDLAQSPYVSLVSTSAVRAALTTMMRKPDEAMTPAMAREVCERTNSQAVLTVSIARAGQHYLVLEEATNCVDGGVLGQARYDAARPEELPNAMGKMAATLRRKLGESRRSIARFNTPLFDQNTASLDALKAFTQGTQKAIEGKIPEAIGLLDQSVAADPQFPAAYYNLAAAYTMSGDDLHAREFIEKAYALRDRATTPTRFGILAMYDSNFTGDMYELLRTHQSWVDLYPNSSQAWSGLANAQRDLRMYREALVSSLRTVQLIPHSQGMLANLALDQMYNKDLSAARATCERAIASGLDGDGLRIRYLNLAYLLKDEKLLREQRDWETANPTAAGVLTVESGIATAEGRFNDAVRIIQHIREIHRQQGLFGADEEATKFAAVDLMQSGDVEAGKRLFRESPVDTAEGQEVLGLVYTGDTAGALAARNASDAKYPRATMNHLYWTPKTKAAIAMAEHKPAEAAAQLEIARPFDKLGHTIPWARGNAYLAAGQAALAEKDFRSVVDHPEYDPVSPYLSLSWLGLGEALAAQGKHDGAVAAYQHFLTIWAKADPDALYLVRAKAEYEALQRGKVNSVQAQLR